MPVHGEKPIETSSRMHQKATRAMGSAEDGAFGASGSAQDERQLRFARLLHRAQILPWFPGLFLGQEGRAPAGLNRRGVRNLLIRTF